MTKWISFKGLQHANPICMHTILSSPPRIWANISLRTMALMDAPDSFKQWIQPRDNMEQHLLQAKEEIEYQLEQAAKTGTSVNFFQFFDKLVTLINVRIILGKRTREKYGDEIVQLVQDLEHTAATPSTIAVPFLLFWPTVFKCYFARKKVLNLFRKVIEDWRQSGEDPSFFLCSVIPKHAPVTAAAFSAYQMMYVAHTNTASTIGWGLLHLSQNPKFMTEVTKEIENTDLSTSLSNEIFASMTSSKRALYETIRMSQGAIFSRAVTDNLEIDGYTIPKGTTLSIYPRYFHYNEKQFPDPYAFNPDRFLEANGTEKQMSCVLFGHGLHVCLGKNLASKLIPLCWSLILSKYKFEVELPNGMPEPNWSYMSGIPIEGTCDAFFKLFPKK